MKDEQGGQIMEKFNKQWWWKEKGKRHKKVCHKKKFKDFKNCPKTYQIIQKINYLEN